MTTETATVTFQGQGNEADRKADSFIAHEAKRGHTWKEYLRHDDPIKDWHEIKLQKITEKPSQNIYADTPANQGRWAAANALYDDMGFPPPWKS